MGRATRKPSTSCGLTPVSGSDGRHTDDCPAVTHHCYLVLKPIVLEESGLLVEEPRI